MKKVVRTSLNNVANKRGVRDLNIQLYSHDKNNAGFEFVIKNEVDLSEYKAKVLFDFQESFATWETKGAIEGNVVKVKFDTTFITKCEEVIGYLFLDSETDTLDVFKFKFNVVLSEIDKYDTAKRGFRYIKDQEVVDVITRSELEEELKKIQINGGIDLSNYLTTSVANDTFATKQELGSYATKDELPSISGLVTTEQLTAAKNNVVEEISNRGYVTSTVVEETYAKKSDLPTPYNDSALVQKIGQLEARVDNDTVYDDAPLKERVTALESKAIEGGAYDDTHLRERLDNLEAKQDKDTVYDDAPLKQRVEALETKVDKDTVYNDEEVKQRLTVLENKPTVDLSDYATKQELQEVKNNQPTVDTSNLVTRQELEEKHYLTKMFFNNSELAQKVNLMWENDSKIVTEEELEEKHYVTNEQISSTYATKSEIPQPYSDTELVKRITVLENRQDNDTIYDDAELKRRVTALEERPATGGSVDISNLVTKDELKEKEDTIYEEMNNNPLYKIYTEGTLMQHLNSQESNNIGNIDARGGIIYSDARFTTVDIFKGDTAKEKFVDFQTAMFTLANSIPDNYKITHLLYSGKDDNKVIFLSNKNFSEVVPKEELKTIIKEVLTELKSENN